MSSAEEQELDTDESEALTETSVDVPVGAVVAGNEPAPAPSPAPPPPTPTRRWRRTLVRARAVVEYAPVLVLLPFLFLFFLTVIPRFSVPFELEWREGHVAEQAWRFSQGMALYPEPEAANWVPPMHPPLFHVVYGAVMRATGDYTLAWGRFLSLASALAALAAVGLIVFDHTRRMAPVLVSGLLFLAYFKASGASYDIVRPDGLALALGAWGVYWACKRRVATWQGIAATVALFLAVMTHQTMAILAVGGAAVVMARCPRGFLVALAAICFVAGNLAFMAPRTGNTHFVKYVVENPARQPVKATIHYPGELSAAQFAAQVPEGAGWWSTYWRLHRESPSRVWTAGLRHGWLLALVVVAWMVVSLLRRRAPRGWLLLIPAGLLAWGALRAYAQYSGSAVDFAGMYLGLAIASGLALDGLRRALPGGWRLPASVVLAGVVAAQVYQPWNMPARSDVMAALDTWRRERDPDESRAMMVQHQYHHQAQTAREAGDSAALPTRPDVTTWQRLRFEFGRLNSAGLTWFPSHLQPHDDAVRAHERLAEWLALKAGHEEYTLVLHHQWHGILAGHPAVANAASVQNAMLAGDKMLEAFRASILSGKFRWIVVDFDNGPRHWLPGATGQMIEHNYERIGLHPAYDGISQDALLPVTGGEMRPLVLYRRKGTKAAPRPVDW